MNTWQLSSQVLYLGLLLLVDLSQRGILYIKLQEWLWSQTFRHILPQIFVFFYTYKVHEHTSFSFRMTHSLILAAFSSTVLASWIRFCFWSCKTMDHIFNLMDLNRCFCLLMQTWWFWWLEVWLTCSSSCFSRAAISSSFSFSTAWRFWQRLKSCSSESLDWISEAFRRSSIHCTCNTHIHTVLITIIYKI